MIARTIFDFLSPGGARGKLSILIFHRVLPRPDPLFPDEPDAARFDELMQLIAAWFNVLPLDEAVSRLRLQTLPPRAACITFDDGYADNYTVALPILRRHGLKATFFIASGFLDGGRMWNDTVIEAVRGAKVAELDFGLASVPAGSVGTDAEKRGLLSRLLPAVKHLPPTERDEVVARIAEASGALLPDDLMMTTEQVRGLRDAGMLIGAHTVTHPILAACSDEQAWSEIKTGREQLELILDERVALFAYPNGKPGADYTHQHVEMVVRLGFDAAVSTSWGANQASSDKFQLLRFTPWSRARWKFAAHLAQNLRRGAPEVLVR
ncbi:Carbohydrate esterase family protein [Thauera humireducens]|uniref:polysaccharide deacetylase family protein n=1 Tax=Thauera humireducens TaxID=1134435 RepID=UPI002467A57E|nr:polysaccharide deacetylase family protein [Thauera humireducens]CAH1747216.1 Carbohydrate esterase family protein [Thauera humireducens]